MQRKATLTNSWKWHNMKDGFHYEAEVGYFIESIQGYFV